MSKDKTTNKTSKLNEIRIVKFQPKYAERVTNVIRETYKKFCSCDANKEFNKMSFSFYDYKKNKKELLNMLSSSDINLVLLVKCKIVGIAEGSKYCMNNFFIDKNFHNRGLGKILLSEYENKVLGLGVKIFRIYSSSNAVDFYERMGYKKSTGVRNYKGEGIFLQPMKKILD